MKCAWQWIDDAGDEWRCTAPFSSSSRESETMCPTHARMRLVEATLRTGGRVEDLGPPVGIRDLLVPDRYVYRVRDRMTEVQLAAKGLWP